MGSWTSNLIVAKVWVMGNGEIRFEHPRRARPTKHEGSVFMSLKAIEQAGK